MCDNYDDNSDEIGSISDVESIEDILEKEWLDELDFIESNYEKFYNTDNININVYSIYYSDNKIEHISKEKVELIKKNVLSENELLKIIKDKSKNKYKLDSILRYNIDMKPSELINFKNNIEKHDKFKYMNRIKSVETIYFMPSIQMFSDLNTLYLFLEKKDRSNINTKKIRYTPIIKKQKKTKKNNNKE